MASFTYIVRVQKLQDQLSESIASISLLLSQVTSLEQIDHIMNVEVLKAANTYKMLGSLLKISSGLSTNSADVQLSGDVNNLF